MSGFVPTDEQQACVDLFGEGDDMVIDCDALYMPPPPPRARGRGGRRRPVAPGVDPVAPLPVPEPPSLFGDERQRIRP